MEVRSYGGGYLLVDQKPNELISTAISNSNFKICHKIPSINQILSIASSLNLERQHIDFITRLQPGECLIKIEKMDLPFLIKVDLIKSKDWGIKNGVGDAEIFQPSRKYPYITNIEYTISFNRPNKPLIMKITEIDYKPYQKDIITLTKPNKADCQQYSNLLSQLLQTLLKLHTHRQICSNCGCLQLRKNSPALCYECQQPLSLFPDYWIKPLDITWSGLTLSKIFYLQKFIIRHSNIYPSEYDSVSQRKLNQFKKEFLEFKRLKDDYDFHTHHKNTKSSSEIANKFGNSKNSSEKSPGKSKRTTNRRDKSTHSKTPSRKKSKLQFHCKCPNLNKVKVSKLGITLVRHIPSKFTYRIVKVRLKCSRCDTRKTFLFSYPKNYSEIPSFIPKVKETLHKHLSHHQFCPTCEQIFENRSKCPYHEEKLVFPKLVYVQKLYLLYRVPTGLIL
jgi:hypothetical protein